MKCDATPSVEVEGKHEPGGSYGSEHDAAVVAPVGVAGDAARITGIGTVVRCRFIGHHQG